jgi:Aspartyl/Asparaginyl beta-hydroxylase
MEDKSMRFFKKIESILAPDSLVNLREELNRNSILWDADESRQNNIQVQRNTECIPLRHAVRKPGHELPARDIQQSGLSRYARYFPYTVTFLNQTAFRLGGTLERALYVRLRPHAKVYAHRDDGNYYLNRDRYHYVVWSDLGSKLTSGDETIIMKPGELWWFDNKALHESENDADSWRVHLIFDVL